MRTGPVDGGAEVGEVGARREGLVGGEGVLRAGFGGGEEEEGEEDGEGEGEVIEGSLRHFLVLFLEGISISEFDE